MYNSIYDFIKEKLSILENPIIIEIGTNTGLDTHKIYDLLNNPKYIAFEPDPDHIKTMLGLPVFNKIIFYPLAIGKEKEIKNFYPAYDEKNRNTGSGGLLKPKTHLQHFPHISFPKSINVEVTTLDYVFEINKLNHIDFIWADIQGSEGDMIIGGQKALNSTKYLFTEYSDLEYFEGQKSLDDLLNLLPGKWKILQDFKSDVLFENLNLCQ